MLRREENQRDPRLESMGKGTAGLRVGRGERRGIFRKENASLCAANLPGQIEGRDFFFLPFLSGVLRFSKLTGRFAESSGSVPQFEITSESKYTTKRPG